MEHDLANLRRDYSLKELSESSVAADPFAQFSNWFDEYVASGPIEPNAFVLSTVGADSQPSSRVVLMKGFDSRGFVFFTNYGSRKSRELEASPQASIHFFWPELERQVQVAGRAEKTSREESEAYFATRPRLSQLGAWASKQSETLENREQLEKKMNDLSAQYGESGVPCPPFWGGFRIVPTRFEFWQGRRSRLHDRICYEPLDGGWRIFRLSP